MNVASLQSLITHWPTDWILVGALAVIFALDTIRSGSARAATAALAAPLTLLLLGSLPQTYLAGDVVQQLSSPAAQALLFGVVFAALFLAIHRIVYSLSENGTPLQALIAGLAAATVLVVVWIQVPVLQSLWHFGPQVQLIFGEANRLWWLLGAYLALAFVRG